MLNINWSLVETEISMQFLLRRKWLSWTCCQCNTFAWSVRQSAPFFAGRTSAPGRPWSLRNIVTGSYTSLLEKGLFERYTRLFSRAYLSRACLERLASHQIANSHIRQCRIAPRKINGSWMTITGLSASSTSDGNISLLPAPMVLIA